MDGVCLVERWIAWFAAKCYYFRVLEVFGSRTNGPNLLELGLPPSALAACGLHRMVKNDDVDRFEDGLVIVETLSTAIKEKISAMVVARIISSMKCKMLFRMIGLKRPDVVEQLKNFFPKRNENSDSELTVEQESIANLQEHFRSFFLSLTASKEYLRGYMKQHYSREFGYKFDLKLLELVERLLAAINTEFPKTPIEKILEAGPKSDFVQQLHKYNISSVDLLLDWLSLKSDLGEADCLNLLQVLRPPKHSGIRHREGYNIVSTSIGLGTDSTDWFESQPRHNPNKSNVCTKPCTGIKSPTTRKRKTPEEISPGGSMNRRNRRLYKMTGKQPRLSGKSADPQNPALSTSTGFVPEVAEQGNTDEEEDDYDVSKIMPFAMSHIRTGTEETENSVIEACVSEDFELHQESVGCSEVVRENVFTPQENTDPNGDPETSTVDKCNTISASPTQDACISSSGQDSDSLVALRDGGSSDTVNPTLPVSGVCEGIEGDDIDPDQEIIDLSSSGDVVTSSGQMASPDSTLTASEREIWSDESHGISMGDEQDPMQNASPDSASKLKRHTITADVHANNHKDLRVTRLVPEKEHSGQTDAQHDPPPVTPSSESLPSLIKLEVENHYEIKVQQEDSTAGPNTRSRVCKGVNELHVEAKKIEPVGDSTKPAEYLYNLLQSGEHGDYLEWVSAGGRFRIKDMKGLLKLSGKKFQRCHLFPKYGIAVVSKPKHMWKFLDKNLWPPHGTVRRRHRKRPTPPLPTCTVHAGGSCPVDEYSSGIRFVDFLWVLLKGECHTSIIQWVEDDTFHISNGRRLLMLYGKKKGTLMPSYPGQRFDLLRNNIPKKLIRVRQFSNLYKFTDKTRRKTVAACQKTGKDPTIEESCTIIDFFWRVLREEQHRNVICWVDNDGTFLVRNRNRAVALFGKYTGKSSSTRRFSKALIYYTKHRIMLEKVDVGKYRFTDPLKRSSPEQIGERTPSQQQEHKAPKSENWLAADWTSEKAKESQDEESEKAVSSFSEEEEDQSSSEDDSSVWSLVDFLWHLLKHGRESDVVCWLKNDGTFHITNPDKAAQLFGELRGKEMTTLQFKNLLWYYSSRAKKVKKMDRVKLIYRFTDPKRRPREEIDSKVAIADRELDASENKDINLENETISHAEGQDMEEESLSIVTSSSVEAPRKDVDDSIIIPSSHSQDKIGKETLANISQHRKDPSIKNCIVKLDRTDVCNEPEPVCFHQT